MSDSLDKTIKEGQFVKIKVDYPMPFNRLLQKFYTNIFIFSHKKNRF